MCEKRREKHYRHICIMPVARIQYFLRVRKDERMLSLGAVWQPTALAHVTGIGQNHPLHRQFSQFERKGPFEK